MNIFCRGDFKLSSGLISSWKIDCDYLSDPDLQTLVHLACKIIPPFGSVEVIPNGGIRFGNLFRPFISSGPVLIVDDVFTTGRSLEKQRANRDAIGLVIFARGHLPYWIRALFHTNVPL